MYAQFLEYREEYEGKVRSLISDYAQDLVTAGSEVMKRHEAQQRFERNWATARDGFQHQIKSLFTS